MMKPALLFSAWLLSLPALALEPIDEGEVALGQGSVVIMQNGCPPRGPAFDTTTVVRQGPLTADAIQKTFEANQRALATTYLRGLARNRCLAGSVRLHVATAATGLVTRVDLEFSNPELAVLRDALTQDVRGFHFDLTGAPSSFSYTLDLAPK